MRFSVPISVLGIALASLAAISATKDKNAKDPSRIDARVVAPTKTCEPGERRLELGGKDVLLYVPPQAKQATQLPMVLFLHGAVGGAERAIRILRVQAEDRGVILLVPNSREQTWDAITDDFGPDVKKIDQALQWTYDHCPIDGEHVAIGGFSDGATYALSLGLTNGDLFTHILSFSPGFMRPAAQRGRPLIFDSHGTHDSILAIEQSSRVIVPKLKNAGYNVEYREFDGDHEVPQEIRTAAMDWFLGKKK